MQTVLVVPRVQVKTTYKVNMLVEKLGTCPQSKRDKITEAVEWVKESIWKLIFAGAGFFVVWAVSKSVLFGESSIFHAILHWLGVPHN